MDTHDSHASSGEGSAEQSGSGSGSGNGSPIITSSPSTSPDESGLVERASSLSPTTGADDEEAAKSPTHGRAGSYGKSYRSGSSSLERKERKKYVLTKQREYWTDEEHWRFLAALRKHGRAWKQIMREVGTKSAIQIRSHAQKYFQRLKRAEKSIQNSVGAQLKSDAGALSPFINAPRIASSQAYQSSHHLMAMPPTEAKGGFLHKASTRYPPTDHMQPTWSYASRPLMGIVAGHLPMPSWASTAHASPMEKSSILPAPALMAMDMPPLAPTHLHSSVVYNAPFANRSMAAVGTTSGPSAPKQSSCLQCTAEGYANGHLPSAVSTAKSSSPRTLRLAARPDLTSPSKPRGTQTGEPPRFAPREVTTASGQAGPASTPSVSMATLTAPEQRALQAKDVLTSNCLDTANGASVKAADSRAPAKDSDTADATHKPKDEEPSRTADLKKEDVRRLDDMPRCTERPKISTSAMPIDVALRASFGAPLEPYTPKMPVRRAMGKSGLSLDLFGDRLELVVTSSYVSARSAHARVCQPLAPVKKIGKSANAHWGPGSRISGHYSSLAAPTWMSTVTKSSRNNARESTREPLITMVCGD